MESVSHEEGCLLDTAQLDVCEGVVVAPEVGSGKLGREVAQIDDVGAGGALLQD